MIRPVWSPAKIAQHALREREILVEQRRGSGSFRAGLHVGPDPLQVLDVQRQIFLVGRLGHGADDVSARLALWQLPLELLLEGLSFGLVLDALRHGDMRIARQVHQKTAGNRNLGGESRALGSDRILEHLHHHRLALGQDPLDGLLRVAVAALLPDVRHVQEGRAIEADVDEGGLHSGKHPLDTPHVQVADQSPVGGALHVQFLHDAVQHHSDTRFLGRDVDQDVLGHARLWNFRSRAAVS